MLLPSISLFSKTSPFHLANAGAVSSSKVKSPSNLSYSSLYIFSPSRVLPSKHPSLDKLVEVLLCPQPCQKFPFISLLPLCASQLQCHLHLCFSAFLAEPSLSLILLCWYFFVDFKKPTAKMTCIFVKIHYPTLTTS